MQQHIRNICVSVGHAPTCKGRRLSGFGLLNTSRQAGDWKFKGRHAWRWTCWWRIDQWTLFWKKYVSSVCAMVYAYIFVCDGVCPLRQVRKYVCVHVLYLRGVHVYCTVQYTVCCSCTLWCGWQPQSKNWCHQILECVWQNHQQVLLLVFCWELCHLLQSQSENFAPISLPGDLHMPSLRYVFVFTFFRRRCRSMTMRAAAIHLLLFIQFWRFQDADFSV